MENSVTRKDIWDIAAKAGLVLGLVSVAYLAVSQIMTPKTASVGVSMLFYVLGLVLWGIKFGACIYLMKFFMKKLVVLHPEASNTDTLRLGICIAALSALIYSGFYLAFTTIIVPDTYDQALSILQESYSSMLTSESMEQLENMNFASLGFFSQLIYCFIYGTVLSLILSRNIPSRNPFERMDGADQQ